MHSVLIVPIYGRKIFESNMHTHNSGKENWIEYISHNFVILNKNNSFLNRVCKLNILIKYMYIVKESVAEPKLFL